MAGRAEMRPQRAGHVAHPDELAGGEKPLSGGGGGDHRLDVHVSQIADVDDLQPIRGVPGILPCTIRATIPTEPTVLVVRIGPKTAPGRIVARVIGPSYPAMKSHAAFSASVFAFR